MDTLVNTLQTLNESLVIDACLVAEVIVRMRLNHGGVKVVLHRNMNGRGGGIFLAT